MTLQKSEKKFLDSFPRLTLFSFLDIDDLLALECVGRFSYTEEVLLSLLKRENLPLTLIKTPLKAWILFRCDLCDRFTKTFPIHGKKESNAYVCKDCKKTFLEKCQRCKEYKFEDHIEILNCSGNGYKCEHESRTCLKCQPIECFDHYYFHSLRDMKKRERIFDEDPRKELKKIINSIRKDLEERPFKGIDSIDKFL